MEMEQNLRLRHGKNDLKNDIKKSIATQTANG